MGVLRKILSFFTTKFVTPYTVITPPAPYTLGLRTGVPIVGDSDQATPNDYITCNNGSWSIGASGIYSLTIYGASIVSKSHNAWTDAGGFNIGFTNARFDNGYFASENGVHNGTNFVGSFFRNAAGTEGGIKVPTLTTAQKNAMSAAWGASQAGYMCYDSTLNQMQFWNSGAWVAM